MKQDINIYTNIKNFNFFNQIVNKHIISYRSLDELLPNNINNDEGGIIINKNLTNIGVDLNILSKNYIVITSDNNLKEIKKNIKILKPPFYPYQLIKNIEDFLNNNFLEIGDISIFNQKIQHLKNKKTHPLTEIEYKILIYLIENKFCTKEYIKEKVLNIKPSIETNSVDTHLTRIRKKFDSINTEIKIKTKNNIITIEAIPKE